MTHAVVFVPPGPINEIFVNQCIAHCAHRGYEIAGLVRGDWPAALSLVRGGFASVVVFAREEHWDETWEPRVEFCGETTRALFRHNSGPDQPVDKPHRTRPRIIS